MKDECANHEAIIVERVSKMIDDKVEYSVTKKISGITRWIVGTVVTVVGMFIFVIVSNSYNMGKIDAQYQAIDNHLTEQKEINKELKKITANLKDELDETESNQLVIMANMKRFDPNFVMPFQLRGEIID